jgi:glutamyl-tRNA synthetase
MRTRTRFAPSPTGDLHLGGALVALASWLLARATGGVFVVRVEDLDPPRVVPGSADAILDDLEWLGLTWDEGPRVGGTCAPYTQSERGPLYRAAVELLDARGLVYPCDCSRQEIARAASAPHLGEEVAYPGTCRERDPRRAFKRPPALRFRAPPDAFAWDDLVRGRVAMSADVAGDFVLVRGDGVFAYQLAVAVDDWAMGITDVVRGDDLLSSTPRQLALLGALGVPANTLPRYGHVPLVRAPDGSRLAKRTPRSTVRELREGGALPEQVIAELLARAIEPRGVSS